MSNAYSELCRLSREGATLGAVGRLLAWDQETYMPKAAGATRAEESAIIAGLVHERRTSKRIGELIAACEGDGSLTGDADSAVARNIREMRRDYDLATKLPSDLVEELARTGSLAQEAWKTAREKNDFPAFAPWLEKMVGLTRRKAECYGVPAGGELYDALLDEYEPGMTARQVEAIFDPLRERLSAFIAEVAEKGEEPSTKVLKAKVDPADQHKFGLSVLEAIGFDLNAGRLDTTTHPFCEGMAPGDTRLTTRYREQSFVDALYSTMHEAGHGLYEQGLPKLAGLNGHAPAKKKGKKGAEGAAEPEHAGEPLWGTPLAEAISLGIHESQSRMWENFVGRSRPFWRWAMPRARKMYGKALKGASPKDLYKAVNTCRPSFIRVEADESTYNLHVMLRFGIERAMIAGDLKVADLPRVWNERFEQLLGLKVPDDRRGCLQDVHWSFGLFGYFPTYTLGNLYAGQFWEKISKDIRGLDEKIEEGEFAPLLAWLRKNIHVHGKRWRAAELCEKVTGAPLSAEPYLRYIEGKIRPIYGME